MAKISLSLYVLVFSFCIVQAVRSDDSTNAYIKAQCQATGYPNLCTRSLSKYISSSSQSPYQVAKAALLVSLVRAKSTSTYMTQVVKKMNQSTTKEYQAVSDCLCQINNSVDQLTQSTKELQRVDKDGERSFQWHSSNIKTWISTAVTNSNMCLNGFSGHTMGGKVDSTIKAKVLNVAQLCSNTLALFNRYVARHRARGKP